LCRAISSFTYIIRQVGIPYLRAKAKDYFEELGGGIDSDLLEDVSDARRIQALTDEVCSAQSIL
jgi:hypothetical protein